MELRAGLAAALPPLFGRAADAKTALFAMQEEAIFPAGGVAAARPGRRRVTAQREGREGERRKQKNQIAKRIARNFPWCLGGGRTTASKFASWDREARDIFRPWF